MTEVIDFISEDIDLVDEGYVPIFKIKECFLLQDGTVYKLILSSLESDINIKYNQYEKKINLNELSSLTHKRFNSIDESFKYMSKIFDDNKIKIKSINNRLIKLSFYLNDFNQEEIEINLDYDENNKNSILEDLNNINNKLRKDNIQIKKELNKYKNEIKNIKIIQNNENPKEIKYSRDIATDSFAAFSLVDSFTIFRSINNILKLVYATKDKAIIYYDLNNQTVLNKSFYCHNNYITNLRHYLDEISKRDIIMSISKKDNNLKLWNADTWENICNMTNVNQNDFLYSASFLKDNNYNFIITSNGCNRQFYMNLHNFEPMKIYNFRGEKLKEIEQSNDCTFFVDTYYDTKLSKNFIITGNYNYIKTYDFDKNEIYHKYFENNNGIHPNVIIKKNEEKIKLIESCEDGIIRMWGFHSGNLLRKIQTENNNLYGICLWNDNYAFVGCKDQTIKLIELKNGLLIKTFKEHKGRIISFKKVEDPNLGELLFSQGLDQKIKLWIYNKKEINPINMNVN